MLREIADLEIRIVRLQQDLAAEYRLREAASDSEEQYRHEGNMEHLRWEISELRDELAEVVYQHEASR